MDINSKLVLIETQGLSYLDHKQAFYKTLQILISKKACSINLTIKI